MSIDWSTYPDVDLNAAPPGDPVGALLSKVPELTDPDFVAFIRSHDGGEGTIGEDYIVFDPVDEILAASDSEYRRRSLLPFASDGGDRLYAFKVQKMGCPVLMLSMTSTSAEDVREVGTGFRDFIERLSRGEVSWVRR